MFSRTRRAGFIIIWGHRTRASTLGAASGRCARCSGPLVLREARRWFTLFFIPVSPMGAATKYKLCPRCGTKFNAGPQAVATVRPAVAGYVTSAQQPLPVYSQAEPQPGDRNLKWWGWAFLGGSALIVLVGLFQNAVAGQAIFFSILALAVCLVFTIGTRFRDGDKIAVCSVTTGVCWALALIVAIASSLGNNRTNVHFAQTGQVFSVNAINPNSVQMWLPMPAQPPTIAQQIVTSPFTPPNPPTFTPPPQPSIQQFNNRPQVNQPNIRVGNRPVKPTQIVGNNTTGGMFIRTLRTDAPMIGFRWSTTTHAPMQTDPDAIVIRSIEPLSTAPANTNQQTAGHSVTGFCLARDGYAVGGLNVEADNSAVRAVQVIFMRYQNGALVPSDQYTSDWIGTSSGSGSTQLAGDGRQVVGVTGRRSFYLLGLGLMTTDPAAANSP